MKQKVLYILHLPPPMHGAALVGNYIKESAAINEHFDCTYINLSASNYLNEIGKFNLGKLLRIIKLQLSVLFKLIFNKYDLCYITLTSKGPGFYKDAVIVFLVKLFKIKIVFHFHNKGVSQHKKNRLNEFLYTHVFKNTNTILLSEYLVFDIEKYVTRSNIFICANGIVEVNPSNKLNTGIRNNGVCKLLFLSNMMKEKGVVELLHACVILKNSNVKFECHFIGNWMSITEAYFRNFVQENKLSDYVFAHGRKVGEEKDKFLLESDMFVFPTYYDCFPIALLEAMQYSLPIISTYEGGIRDIVLDGINGYTVLQKDANALVEKINVLIADKEKRIQMGRAGREIYDTKFTISKFEERFTTILNEILLK